MGTGHAPRAEHQWPTPFAGRQIIQGDFDELGHPNRQKRRPQREIV
ncbi:hypothetical protein C2W64_03794 [Brevibacillus laterosporus]|nr:hypothetical protein C2W64_03794 [Brevibacillus laterosporus]